ncbi:sensor histidine kinase KdpD [bacterium]|nr:sensor histidine kinase KdpD [bacterium]
MADPRPNPDVLLAKIEAEERHVRRGSLRIFFGYAAGVGKTYTMLQTAHRARDEGRDVVIGYVEPHARPDTQAIAEGFETLPVREVPYRGVNLREFDLAAALARRPEILLVDELAHTNAPDLVHEKRWQDVQELLDAGIDVWTTLNVQHIESLNDVIGQITGVVVRETIPDHVFDAADELELVDITPEELLERLQAGNIYLPEQARHALERFFQRPNLAALRELSLRQAARRVHTDVESARVIRTAKRMATALDADWLAVSVDVTGAAASAPSRRRVAEHVRLAERLGAETATLAGQDVARTVVEFARSRNVTKILIGRTHRPRWSRYFFGSVVDDLIESAGSIDVAVIHGEEDPAPTTRPDVARRPRLDAIGILEATLAVAVAAAAAGALRWSGISDAEANTVMIFLAAVAWSAFRHGRVPAAMASVLAVLTFDFLFVPPALTLAVSDVQYVFTFAVMLAIGLVISALTARLRGQVESTRERERRTAALYELGRQLGGVSGQEFLSAAAARKVSDIFGGEAAVYLNESPAPLVVVAGRDTAVGKHPLSLPAAQWATAHDQPAGAGTNTLAAAIAFFVPLVGSNRTLGAVGVRASDMSRLADPEERRLLEACAAQLAVALDRDRMTIEASEARIQAEAEVVRSNLLAGVSHDLRTPLAAIAGASSSLLGQGVVDAAVRRQLLETIEAEARRLARLLENVLQMSRLDAGAATPNLQWHVLEEIVGSALHRVEHGLIGHDVGIRIPGDLPLVHVDGLLLEQVFVNLLENTARHTPAGTHVTISAAVDGRNVRIAVADDGPGLPAGAEDRVFDRFFQAGPAADAGRGTGLGLAICRAIIEAHRGSITAARRPGGGAEFVIRLPLADDAPRIVVE